MSYALKEALGELFAILLVILAAVLFFGAVSCTSTQRKAAVPDIEYGRGLGSFEGGRSYQNDTSWLAVRYSGAALLALMGVEPNPLLVKYVGDSRHPDPQRAVQEAPTSDLAPASPSDAGAGSFLEGVAPWMEHREASPADSWDNPATWGPTEWSTALGSLLVLLGGGEAIRRKRRRNGGES